MPGFLTREISAHASLNGLLEATRCTGLPIQIITLMEVVPPARWSGWPRKAAKKLGLLVVHFVLAWDILRLPRGHFGLVREFLSVPTLLIWPAVWFRRRRLLFVVNHNFDFAMCSRVHRLALRLLWLAGIRLLCFESTAALAELGFTSNSPQAFSIPTPLPESRLPRAAVFHEPPVIGVVGSVRSEKGFDDLLRVLTEASRDGELSARFLIGTNDANARRRCAELGWETVDTTLPEDYFAAMSRCDVLVFNYRQPEYFFRISGVVADAISAGTFVVTPNCPGIVSQISEPTRVGIAFSSMDDLPAVLARALKLAAETPREAYDEQIAARGPACLAKRLREIFQTFESAGATIPTRV